MSANDGDAAAEIFDLAGNAFRGMVRLEAVAQFSDPKKASQALGKTKALESRNHQRMLGMARKHVEALQARLNDTQVRRGCVTHSSSAVRGSLGRALVKRLVESGRRCAS